MPPKRPNTPTRAGPSTAPPNQGEMFLISFVPDSHKCPPIKAHNKDYDPNEKEDPHKMKNLLLHHNLHWAIQIEKNGRGICHEVTWNGKSWDYHHEERYTLLDVNGQVKATSRVQHNSFITIIKFGDLKLEGDYEDSKGLINSVQYAFPDGNTLQDMAPQVGCEKWIMEALAVLCHQTNWTAKMDYSVLVEWVNKHGKNILDLDRRSLDDKRQTRLYKDFTKPQYRILPIAKMLPVFKTAIEKGIADIKERLKHKKQGPEIIYI